MPLKKEDFHTSVYPSHTPSLPRLNRAIGQLEGVKRMIEGGRYCLDILTQLRAVRTAIHAAENDVLKRHLDECVLASFDDSADSQRKITEVKKLLDFMV